MTRSALLHRVVATTTVALVAAGGLSLTATSAQADPASIGVVHAWGDGSYNETTVPVDLDGQDVVGISAGVRNSLALTKDGVVHAWGGDGYSASGVPASLTGRTVTAVSAGYVAGNLALLDDGSVVSWGPYSGSVPTSLTGQRVTSVSAGWLSSLALTAQGTVSQWNSASDFYGCQMPMPPSSLVGKEVTQISAGWYTDLALTSDGKVTAWGCNNEGANDVPSSLDGLTVTSVSAGGQGAIALDSTGSITTWGFGAAPAPSSLDSKTVVAVAAGYGTFLALTSDGEVTAWGSGSDTTVPGDVSGVTQISSGYTHSMAIVGGHVSTLQDFTTATTATITGTPQVGKTLTAEAGTVDPTPDSTSYQWLADGTAIDQATSGTFVPTKDQLGAKISVEVTSVKSGYTSSANTSAATDEVAAGTITMAGTDTVTGTGTVGQTLAADSSAVTADPTATLSGHWLRDGTPIPGQTASTYDLTNDDAGTTITHQVIAAVDGYTDGTVTSNGVGPVDGGTITLPTPTVTGTAVVDGTLTASLPSATSPGDAVVTYEWFRGTTSVGTGSTYSPEPTDVGHALTVEATARKTYYDDVSTSSSGTDDVAAAEFGTGPTASVTGTAKVGQTLTAGVGAASPTPGSYIYQWYADGTAISGATASTYTLQAAQRHTAITVEVTAVRDGYRDASDLSDATGDVATELAPTLDLSVASPAIRRGQSTTLTWGSGEATGLTASGGWAGSQQAGGTVTVKPTSLGSTTYVLSATNANGTTTAQVSVQVTRQATALAVATSDGLRLRGKAIAVTASGLDPNEAYTVRVGQTPVYAGLADGSGRVSRTVTVPSTADEGSNAVTVTGSEQDRTGGDTVRVVANKKLGLGLGKRAVRASDRQTVRVTGLAAGEKVTVRYQGRRISAKGARANAGGIWSGSFAVGRAWGTRTVKVQGQFGGRRATATFTVVRRCSVGHVCA